MSLSNRKPVSDDTKTQSGAQQSQFKSEQRDVKRMNVESQSGSYAVPSSFPSFSYSPIASLVKPFLLYFPGKPIYYPYSTEMILNSFQVPPTFGGAAASLTPSSFVFPPLPPIPEPVASASSSSSFVMPPLPPLPEPVASASSSSLFVMPPLPPIPKSVTSVSSSSSFMMPPLPPIPAPTTALTSLELPPLPPIPESKTALSSRKCESSSPLPLQSANGIPSQAVLSSSAAVSLGVVNSKKDEKVLVSHTKPVASRALTYFVVDNKRKKQKGWNCFDVAVGIERAKLVDFALKNADKFGFRTLLLHDIKSAALNTLVFLDEKAVYEKTNKPNHRKRKYGTMNVVDVLPKAMHTQELITLGNAYHASVDQLNKELYVCNKALGLTGIIMELSEMDEFFKDSAHHGSAAYALYQNLLRNNQSCFEKIKAFDDYLMSAEVYSAYIQYYFGENKWFTIIPDSNSGRGSSMLDVAARYVQSQIIIYCKMKDNAGVLEYNPIAKTDALPEYNGRQKHVEYVGNNHFCELVPVPAVSVASQAAGLTLFSPVVPVGSSSAVSSASAVSSPEGPAQKMHIPMLKKNSK